MRINYDFGDLEAFLAVKETGSFHAAAAVLNLSQPAVTRRVAKLEQALDTRLFERTTRAVKPTLAAKRLQARAEAILEDARETTRAMRDESVAFAHQRGAIVTIAVVPTLLSRLVIPAITRFRAAGHSARLRLLDESTNGVAEAVAGGEADFGLCPLPALEPGTGFEPLFDDRIMAALPKGHPLAGRAGLTPAELAETPLILPARGTGNRVLIDESLARARIPLIWTMETGRSATALELVIQGAGAALLPEAVLSSPMAGAVTASTLEGLDIARPVGLLTRAGQSATAAAEALKAEIRNAA
ncbi:LysR family transcriptional regulator [Cribrihabitans pelagius]|uniref:LysR family transcriptional regulator n=1 Tax=Cribrihabitans pelagius TaxID=1765746 RepID=UPI003B5BD78F